MGLFSSDKVCASCGKQAGMNYSKWGGGMWYLCRSCTDIFGNSILDISKQAKILKTKQPYSGDFTPTRVIGNFLELDDVNKRVLIPDGPFGSKYEPTICNYKDIIGCDVLDEGESIVGGGVGSALVGGALFGDVGALIGGAVGNKTTKKIFKKVQIKVTINNLQRPTAYVLIADGKIPSDSTSGKDIINTIEEILSTMSVIKSQSQSKVAENIQNSGTVTDELLKLKQLLDMGVLTQDEFEIQKRKLLK